MSNSNQDWGFNYTLSNEDNSLELGVLAKHSEHVVSIAGSGSRVLPLLAKQPAALTCIDSSAHQLALTKLRIEAVKLLDYQDYVAFLGYPGFNMPATKRKQIFSDIANQFDDIKRLEPFLEQAQWQGIIYLGKWEQALKKFAKVTSLLSLDSFLSVSDQQEWDAMMTKTSLKLRWYIYIKLLGSVTFLRAFFYKDRLPQMQVANSYYDFFKERFQRLVYSCGLKKSCFAHLMLTGKINNDIAFPIEVDEEHFHLIKEGANNVTMNYLNTNISDFSESFKHPISFVSLSDVPSYLDSATYSRLLKALTNNMDSGATIISRYFAFRPDFSLPENLNLVTEKYQDLISKETTQFYDIDIFQAS
ncbi:DUF3419 family protein [Paraneptunicella aestuarii]|uniref:DUF3419 family protein n=1 Tax=Paraneptunicella aestuarii TaxID=2831148 RepID=UPI001E35A550|nr:DUF3419 family protein [Paraneptunicella aestuarii]UAA37495.1 DUF3419 family protein [Paraneptunicella aestuarii]